MALGRLRNYLVSKESGVNQSAIGKILEGRVEGATWETVENIAMGLEQIKMVAEIAFLETSVLPDNRFVPRFEIFARMDID